MLTKFRRRRAGAARRAGESPPRAARSRAGIPRPPPCAWARPAPRESAPPGGRSRCWASRRAPPSGRRGRVCPLMQRKKRPCSSVSAASNSLDAPAKPASLLSAGRVHSARSAKQSYTRLAPRETSPRAYRSENVRFSRRRATKAGRQRGATKPLRFRKNLPYARRPPAATATARARDRWGCRRARRYPSAPRG